MTRFAAIKAPAKWQGQARLATDGQASRQVPLSGGRLQAVGRKPIGTVSYRSGRSSKLTSPGTLAWTSTTCRPAAPPA